jgi:hypothetical protein
MVDVAIIHRNVLMIPVNAFLYHINLQEMNDPCAYELLSSFPELADFGKSEKYIIFVLGDLIN